MQTTHTDMITQATTLLKCGNHRVFGKDLEHHLADLEHTSGVWLCMYM